MNAERTQQDPIFTGVDRLQLLQLLTRRAMSERHARQSSANPQPDDRQEDAKSGVDVQVPDRWRLVPENVVLYDWQRKCLPMWLADGRGTIKVATGGGKTLFALAAAQALQNEREPDLRVAIVVPTIPLMFQWRDELRRGNLPASAIGLMGGGAELPPLPDVRVLVCVLNSARERLPGLARRAGWPQKMLLVVDECHRTGAAQASKIFDAKPRYTLGLSATPEPDMDEADVPTDEIYNNGVVGKSLGPIIYDFSIKDSLAAGLLTPFEVWHVGLPLAPQEAQEHARLSREITDLRKGLQVRHNRSKSKQGFLAWCQTQASRGGPAASEAQRFIGLANGRKRLLYHATARSDAALGILSESLSDQDGRAIVFHEAIDEIEALFLRAVERGMPAVLEHSQLPESLRADAIEAFREGVARMIISARSLVEGFNVPSADLGIIAASSGSVRQRIQSLGRMLRRKPGGRTARVFVLYVHDTEDEVIYEKADWESVIGAERNRYFVWHREDQDLHWPAGLDETARSPRPYRIPSRDVDVGSLSLGDPYPGQTAGREIRVDQDDNLRTEEGAIIAASKALIEAIVQHNPHRRARITPPGHLIVRVDASGSKEQDWRFLGVIDRLPDPQATQAIRLKIMTTSGRRVIARAQERRADTMHFALGTGASRTPEAGAALDRLLSWIREEEARRRRPIRDLYWDGATSYWLEIGGERISCPEPLAPLEFAE